MMQGILKPEYQEDAQDWGWAPQGWIDLISVDLRAGLGWAERGEWSLLCLASKTAACSWGAREPAWTEGHKVSPPFRSWLGNMHNFINLECSVVFSVLLFFNLIIYCYSLTSVLSSVDVQRQLLGNSKGFGLYTNILLILWIVWIF